jgi:polar amino acid transport system substrate-binding protein
VEDSGMMPGSRIVEGRFMLVEQAIASRRGHEAGARFVREFVRDAKRSGLLARVLENNQVRGVAIAPMEG